MNTKLNRKSEGLAIEINLVVKQIPGTAHTGHTGSRA